MCVWMAQSGTETTMVMSDRASDLVTNMEWNTRIAGRWKKKGHINVLEVIAVILGVRLLAREKVHRRKRILICTDSMVAVGALQKGRSSAQALITPLRRFAGLCLSAELYVSLVWISTEANPADGPSRI